MVTAQERSALEEILCYGIREEDAAVTGQYKDSKTCGRNRGSERVSYSTCMEQKLMQFSRPVQMRGKGLQQVPFPRLNPNRIQRSWQAQLQYSSRRAQEADGNY